MIFPRLAQSTVLTSQVTTFETIFGEEVESNNVEHPNDGSDWAGRNTNEFRVVNTFDVTQASPVSGSAVPSSATIIKAELRMVVLPTGGSGPFGDVSAESWDIRRYGTLGDSPSPDTAANAFTRCASGSLYVNTTQYRVANAPYIDDLGATGISDAQNRVSGSAAVWAISIVMVGGGSGGNRYTSFREYTDGTALNRPRLILTWS
jgi:hypothetical protein